jgi:DeoR family fructose operon transcriptional repressor
MLTEERWASILEIVDRERAVSVQALEAALGVSASTIRRDLTQLSRMGKLIKVHGGATSLETQYVGKDIAMEEKYSMNNEEKQIIARYAARLIGPNDFVYIDAGTTTEFLVDHIREMRATYVTNSLTHALKLIHKGCRTFLPGGEVKNTTEAIVGGDALSYIARLHFTIGFWGTNGVTPETGFTTPDPNEALIKKTSMEQCKKRYILCDRSKFSVVSPITFASFDSAMVITGKLTDKKYKNYENIVEVTK